VPTGVLFDVDAVLIDPGATWAAIWATWAELRAVDTALMYAGIHGERGVDTVARVAPELVPPSESESADEICEDLGAVAARLAEPVDPGGSR
jgi:beta-phosphoglucomutase-like phosphatase (HAD superfamily)